MGWRLLLLAVLVALLPAGANALAGKPQRIVSLNLCADELLLRLADREDIASVTFLGADARFSSVAAATEGLHLNHGKAEEVLPLHPDLVLAEPYSARSTTQLLRRAGISVLDLPVPTSFQEVYQQIEKLAKTLGQEERGRRLVTSMQQRLAALGPPPAAGQPLAAVYQPNGFLVGPGTLVHEVLTAAGLRNLAAVAFQDHYGALPVERLLWHQPDLLILNRAEERGASLAHEILRHPALKEFFSEVHTAVVHPSLWTCGGPGLVEAVELLRAAATHLRQAEARE